MLCPTTHIRLVVESFGLPHIRNRTFPPIPFLVELEKAKRKKEAKKAQKERKKQLERIRAMDLGEEESDAEEMAV